LMIPRVERSKELVKCQVSKQYELQRAKPCRPPELNVFSLLAKQVAARDWGACVPARSSSVMTCLARDYVGRVQQNTWARERGVVQKLV